MQIKLASIEQCAGEKLLRIKEQSNPAERLIALKRFLKTERQRLHFRHRFGIGGEPIVAANTLIVDLLLQHIVPLTIAEQFDDVEQSSQFAVIALGGYGRRELAPHSDIDLMFLHHGGKKSEQPARVSEAILYLLWDVGFTVGHSIRSVSECISIAKEDHISRNSMIDARLLWGNDKLFTRLNERLDTEVFDKQKRQLLNELMSERSSRYSKFGGVACLQEPNVKESAGGLRDLHVLLWATRFAYGNNTLPGLVSAGIVPERDAKTIASAYDFLLRIRNELHFLTGRRTDLLSLDLQSQVARNQNYMDTPQQQASEIFMRDYYLQARRLRRLCETHLNRAVMKHEKKGWFSRGRTTPYGGGFVIRDGALDFEPSATVATPRLDGNRMMLAFASAQATGAKLSSDLQNAIQLSLPVVNRSFISSAEAAREFIKLLRAKGQVAAGLRLMHEVDFLGKFIPEFGRITCLVQHDLYHRYTVDEHTLRAIEALDDLANSRDQELEQYREIFNEIADPAVLYLGLFLHDIGKGLGGGHTEKGIKIAGKVCGRLQLDPDATEQVIFLIREHLRMSHISQRRDLGDDKVIQDFATQVGTADRLKMLTLLTYADINGVGQGIWNEWKAALLWELYVKTLAALQPSGRKKGDVGHLHQRIARMLVHEIADDIVYDHFKLLTDEYARSTPQQTIVEHIRLAHSLNSRAVTTSWRVNLQSRCTDLHLCARNRRGLFAAVAGTLTAEGVNILSVRLNTRADGLAVDTFKVRDMAGEPIDDSGKWERITRSIKRALSGELDVAAAVRKRLRAQASSSLRRRKKLASSTARITWDNQSSSRSTILEVRTGDRLGLAYKIASTLTALDLDIVFAKVATEKNLALDVFYITDAAGEKLDSANLPAVEEVIWKSFNEKDADTGMV